MQESVALLAQIDQAPNTANDGDVHSNNGNSEKTIMLFDHNFHVFHQYFQGFCVFLTII